MYYCSYSFVHSVSVSGHEAQLAECSGNQQLAKQRKEQHSGCATWIWCHINIHTSRAEPYRTYSVSKISVLLLFLSALHHPAEPKSKYVNISLAIALFLRFRKWDIGFWCLRAARYGSLMQDMCPCVTMSPECTRLPANTGLVLSRRLCFFRDAYSQWQVLTNVVCVYSTARQRLCLEAAFGPCRRVISLEVHSPAPGVDQSAVL